MRSVSWTDRARNDLAAIASYTAKDSPHYADVLVERIISATEQAAQLPESGRTVPEYANPRIREFIRPPYRIVYRLVGTDAIHILTIHHADRLFPQKL